MRTASTKTLGRYIRGQRTAFLWIPIDSQYLKIAHPIDSDGSVFGLLHRRKMSSQRRRCGQGAVELDDTNSEFQRVDKKLGQPAVVVNVLRSMLRLSHLFVTQGR